MSSDCRNSDDRVRLGDVAEVEKYSIGDAGDEDSVWLLNLDAVEKNTGRVISKSYVSPSELGSSTLAFSDRAVLYSKLRPNLNKVVLPDTCGYATTEMLPLLPDGKRLSREYLACLLRSGAFVNYAVRSTAGAKMPRVNRKDILNYRFILPDMATQTQRAKRFSAIGKQMDLLHAYSEKLDELVKSRFIEMFSGYAADTPLSENCEIVGGLTKNSKRKSFPLVMPYLRVANVQFNELDLSEIAKIGVTQREARDKLLKRGDVLFVEGNGSQDQIGRVAIWDGSLEPMLHQNHLIRVRSNREILLPSFILHYFMSPSGRAQILDVAVSTSGLFTLSTGKIGKLKCPIPPLELQQQFADFVTQVDKLEFEARQAIDKLQLLYDSLAQEYFGD